jgi:hypothetical protein
MSENDRGGGDGAEEEGGGGGGGGEKEKEIDLFCLATNCYAHNKNCPNLLHLTNKNHDGVS